MSSTREGTFVIVHEGQHLKCSHSNGYHPLVGHVLNSFCISNKFLLYSNGKSFDYQDKLPPGEYYTQKKSPDNVDIHIIVRHKGLSCQCGSYKYKFKDLEDYDHAPIETSRFLHVQ